MKKSLFFVPLLLISLCGCNQQTPAQVEEKEALLKEYESFDPRTYSGYQKGETFDIQSELSNDEKRLIIDKLVEKKDRGITKTMYGSYYLGDDGRESYYGGIQYNYTNAVIGFYKDNQNLSSVPGMACKIEDEKEVAIIGYNLYGPNKIREYRLLSKEKDYDYFENYRTVGSGQGGHDDYFRYLSQSLEYEAYVGYKLKNGYLLSYDRTKDQYPSSATYIQYFSVFDNDMRLIRNISYYEPEVGSYEHIKSRLAFQLIEYSKDKKTPTRDLTEVKEALETNDYLYLSKGSFRLTHIDPVEEYEDYYSYNHVSEMRDSEFNVIKQYDSFSSDYLDNNLYIRYGIYFPYGDNNALLACYEFTIEGIVNGKGITKKMSFKFVEDEERAADGRSGVTDSVVNKDGTIVLIMPDENERREDVDYSSVTYQISIVVNVLKGNLVINVEENCYGYFDYRYIH